MANDITDDEIFGSAEQSDETVIEESFTSAEKPASGAVPVTVKSKEEIVEKEPVVEIKERIFRDNRKIFHDLYKLEVESMVKDLGWDKDDPQYHSIEHCHFFHTYDSSGRKQEVSTAVGGHFHIIKVTEQGDGQPPKVECVSGPMTWKMVKVKGKRGRVRKMVPVNDVDHHRHDIQYLQSDEVSLRKANSEAAKLIGRNAMLTTKPADLDVT